MADQPKLSLFPLPATKTVQTLYVQLADGRIVPRSAEEIAALPADVKSRLVLFTPPKEGS